MEIIKANVPTMLFGILAFLSFKENLNLPGFLFIGMAFLLAHGSSK